jgi:hypothetical protein
VFRPRTPRRPVGADDRVLIHRPADAWRPQLSSIGSPGGDGREPRPRFLALIRVGILDPGQHPVPGHRLSRRDAELQVEEALPEGEQLAQDCAMGLGRPLRQHGLEQDLTDPFADRLVASELREQRVVVLSYFRADSAYVVVTPSTGAALLSAAIALNT